MTTDVSNIDKAIAVARAKVALKQATSGETAKAPKVAKPAGEKKAKPTDAEKAAAQAEKDAAKAQRKADRDAKRAAKRAEREAARKPAHLSKVARAAEKLPALSDAAQVLFTDVTTNLPRGQVAAIAAHLAHFNRAQATERALGVKLAVGDTVRIVSGEPRYVGQTGTVTRAQRIRCYCSIPGVKKDVYLFLSDVEKVSAQAAKTA